MAEASSLRAVFAACRFTHAPALDALDTRRLTNIQWRAERCTPSSILCFQRLDDGRSDAELIERYLAHSHFGALVINRPLAGIRDAKARAPEGARRDGSLLAGSTRQAGPLAGRPILVTAPDAWGETLERLCDHFYPPRPAAWRIAGVTGTNGKTTTVKYLESILRAAGRRVLGIGTLGLSLNGEPLAETGFTSPPYIELRRILHRYQAEADTLVMEVSSHALHQGRVHGLRFAAAAWTNFSQDHLDYHGDEASYFAAKARILDQLADGVPLLTTSVEVERRLRSERGRGAPVTRIEAPPLPSEALRARPFLALSYNRANYALARALATRLLGIEPKAPWRALQPVAGRFDCHVHRQRTIVIDFAHTPDALAHLLDAIREAFPRARILTLFGCGGDRDRAKRPLMGAAVCRGSDQAILTSDNPRFEEPQAIADDTLAGMADCNPAPTVILDRAEAIAALFDRLAARPDDEPWVALIAGKGHEPYIDRHGVKHPYSDREQVLRHCRRLGWTCG
ncbi:MAG: Mur ligase family protein [Halochromatium sp.]|uniref:Mur ligase family protein n=1 Tax=Halochromatium sp. TaxID=2049430 RepID=UPI00397D548E